VPRAWQPCGSSPPPLPRAADRVPCLLSRSCSSITARPSGPRLPLSRCRSRPAPWPPWPSGARAHAAAAVLHASSQEPPLARPPWPRSRLAPPPFSPTCAVNHRSTATAIAGQPSSGLTAVTTVRCSSDPVITTINADTPSSARLVASPSSSVVVRSGRRGRSPEPPCSCGQATTGHLEAV